MENHIIFIGDLMKKYLFFIIFILFLLVILLIPKDFKNKDNEIYYEVINEKEVFYVYYIKDNKVIGVPIERLNNDKYELIDLTFKYLTEKSNSVSVDYNTYLNLNAKLSSYEIRGADIYLEVSDNFFKIDNEDILFALAQVLYSYKELGFSDVYITKDKKIISNMNNVVMYDGIDELNVNLDIISTKYETKNVKIIYYFEDNSKLFINHIIDFHEDEVTFKMKKIIEFINKEYKTDITLNNYKMTKYTITVDLNCKEKDIEIIKKLLSDNLNIKKDNIIIS